MTEKIDRQTERDRQERETERDRQVIPQRPTQFPTVTVVLAMKIFMVKYYHKRHKREAFNVKPDKII